MILLAALGAGCGDAGASLGDEAAESVETSSAEQAIRVGTPAPANALLGMVQVSSSRGTCSGTVIAADTILTAAHCFCGEDLVGSNKCAKTATVTFRPNPANGASRTLPGVVRVNPSYNPSWTEAHYEHDIATVTVDGVSPSHVPPVSLLGSYLPENSLVRVAGFGRTGNDCSGGSGTLNFASARIDSYEDGRDIMAFDDFAWCQGDSGGAVFDAQGRQRAVISMETPWLQKAVTTNSELSWIKAGMCRSSRSNRCDGDGVTCDCTARKDILMQNTSGALTIWAMNGSNIESQTWPGVVHNDWKIQGSGDFDGDGEADILWRHDTGQTAIWFMRDGARVGEGYPGGQDPSWTWKIHTTGDFDGDGRSDILWRHAQGQLAIWFQGDANRAAYPGYSNTPHPVDNSWQVQGAGDFNGDGRADILWQHTGGQVAMWLMSGGTRIGEANPGVLQAGTKLAGIGDFDGNSKSDTLWRKKDGSLSVWFGIKAGDDGIAYQNNPGPGDFSWAVQGVGDFDHDGRDDILWRHAGGQLAIWLLLGARFNGDMYPPALDGSWQVKTLLAQSGM